MAKKIAIELYERVDDPADGVSSRPYAFKILSLYEAIDMAKDAVLNNFSVILYEWKNDTIPYQWDDRVVEYRV